MKFFPLLTVVLFLSIPLIEIYLMIQIGSVIGAGWTVFAIVATAVIGVTLIRRQGFGVYQRMHRSMENGELPAMEIFEGLALLISGLLLLTPGFITDSFGFLILVSPLRRWFVLNLLKRHFIQQVDGAGVHAVHRRTEIHRQQRPIDGDFRRLDD